MRILLTSIVLLCAHFSYAQENLYTVPGTLTEVSRDSLTNYMTQALKEYPLPPKTRLVPTIIHKKHRVDTTVYYVTYEIDMTNQKEAFQFKQDPLYSHLDKKLPSFELLGLDGKTYTEKSFEGAPIIINFWNTACAPCIREFPALNDLKKRHGHALNFVSITENSAQRVREFKKSKKFDFLKLIDAYDYEEPILGVRANPTTLLIDENGVLRFISVGLHLKRDNTVDLESLEKAIKNLLK